jgi:hypothetical protein
MNMIDSYSDAQLAEVCRRLEAAGFHANCAPIGYIGLLKGITPFSANAELQVSVRCQAKPKCVLWLSIQVTGAGCHDRKHEFYEIPAELKLGKLRRYWSRSREGRSGRRNAGRLS